VKKYRFRLASVTRIRRIEEDLAVGRLAEANRAVATADRRRDDRAAAYQSLAEERAARSATEFRRDRAARTASAAALAQAVHACETARAIAEERRKAHLVAHQKVEALDRLDARHREAYEAETRKAEELAVDDIVTAKADRPGNRKVEP
jgi:flagellar FliJ protein